MSKHNDYSQYIIKHIPVLRDYHHPINPVNSKKEVKFQYHHKYIEFVKDYKIKHGLKPHIKNGYLPPCLRSFRVFLAYNNLWWLVKKEHLTAYDLKTLNELNIPVYIQRSWRNRGSM